MSWGVEDLSVAYGGRLAVAGVTLACPDASVTAVVGGDGAGKTTLLRCLAGTQAATSGIVRRPAKARIGYLSSASGTYADLTVDENLQFFAAAYGIPAGVAAQARAGLLERMGLAEARNRLAGTLSGGMRQKLGAVCAMLHRPDLLVLDEPTTGLDPVSRADLWRLFAQAAVDGAAVVLSTTYVDEAERASSLLVLDAGRVVGTGTPAELVAGMPGTLLSVADRPPAAALGRAWRHGAQWRLWDPAPGAGNGAALEPSLQDVVVVAALAREAQSAAGTAP